MSNALYLEVIPGEGENKYNAFTVAKQKFTARVPTEQQWRFVMAITDDRGLLSKCWTTSTGNLSDGKAAAVEAGFFESESAKEFFHKN
jgi:hypothetical protein